MTNNIDNIIYSVSNTLNEVFGIFANVGTDGYTIRVRILEEEAEYVQKILETNYCETLSLIAVHHKDKVATLVYGC